MSIPIMWAFIILGVGLIVGYLLCLSSTALHAEPIHSHYECDQRLTRMRHDLMIQIKARDAEIDRLIHGG